MEDHFTVPTDHDALFRDTFAQPESAMPLLRTLLPANVAAAIDWTSLVPDPISFVDQELRQHSADLLFSARIGGRPALLYLLLEHKSSADRCTVFQLLRYMVRIWERCRAQAPENRLPAILPLVVYHGAKGWDAPLTMLELLDLDGIDPAVRQFLAAHLPNPRLLVDDLGSRGEAALMARGLSARGMLSLLSLRLFRGSNPAAVLAALRRWAPLLRALRAAGSRAALTMGWSYTLAVTEVGEQTLAALVNELLGPEEADTIMSTADKLRAEGEVRGRATQLLRLLTRRFGPVPEAIITRVRGATIPELDRWADAVLTANTLDGVFAAE